MNCLQAEEHFSAHFEDTLDYQTLQDFEEHLAVCEVCQHEYTRFQESVKAVQQLPQIDPSPYFMSTLQQRLATEQREPVGVRLPNPYKESVATGWGRLLDVLRRPRWAFSGIMVLILAAAATFFYQDGLLFNRDLRSTPVVAPMSQSQQVATSPEALPESLPHFSKDGNQFLRGSVILTPRQPMQQRYMLKQVSYTSTSTGGGL